MLTLVEPSLTYKNPLLEAVREFHAAGEYDVDAEQLGAKFEDLIARLAAAKDPLNVPPGELPYEDFWLMEGDQWIGKLTLRTTINARYLHAGGHIGYEIRPSKRRQGYGTKLLRMGLEIARARGLQRVLLTCDETNIASRKVIENNGGQLENAVEVEGQTVLKMRYWINLDEMESPQFRSDSMQLTEHFLQSSLPEGFYWFNEPGRYRLGDGLEIFTDEKTDFWQRTHYGFQRDDGHCLLIRQTGDFSLTTHVEFDPRAQYDQCGLIVRIDSQNWIKVSTEYESEHVSRLGSVVTNLGYSDWATQDVMSNHRRMWYRISKRGSDFLLENSYDGQQWLQMRITHLHKEAKSYEIGIYACSPIGKDFRCCFKTLEISDNKWQAILESS